MARHRVIVRVSVETASEVSKAAVLRFIKESFDDLARAQPYPTIDDRRGNPVKVQAITVKKDVDLE